MKNYAVLLFVLVFLQGCAPVMYKPMSADKISQLRDKSLIVTTTETPPLKVRGGEGAGVGVGMALGGIVGGLIAASIAESVAIKNGKPFQTLVNDPTDALAIDLAKSLSKSYGMNYKNNKPVNNFGDSYPSVSNNSLILEVKNLGWEIISAGQYIVTSGTYKYYDQMTDAEKVLAKENKKKSVVVYQSQATFYDMSSGSKREVTTGKCSNLINQTGNYQSTESLQANGGAILQQELNLAASLCSKCYQQHMFGLPVQLNTGESCNTKKIVNNNNLK